MAHPIDKRDYGLRACALLSLLSALVMIFMSSFVFAARIEDLQSSKFSPANLPDNDDPSDTTDYPNILKQLNKLWNDNRPVLASSSMLAVLAGLLQLIFCGLVILSDSKAMQLYIRKWMLIHLILVIVLSILLINTVALTETTTSDDKKSWTELTSTLRKYLEEKRPHNDYHELFRFLGAGETLIYIGVSVDLAIILIVMGATLCLMRNKQGDYEPYE